MGTLANLRRGNLKFILLYKCPQKKFLPSTNGSKNAFISKSFCEIQDNIFFKNLTQGFCDQTPPSTHFNPAEQFIIFVIFLYFVEIIIFLV